MRKFVTILVVALLGSGGFTSAQARDLGLDEEGIYEPLDRDTYDQIAQQDQDVGIPPSEAAAIARDVEPGAKVVGVKLLSNGWYAVTLRAKGSVTRVMVNASTGEVR